MHMKNEYQALIQENQELYNRIYKNIALGFDAFISAETDQNADIQKYIRHYQEFIEKIAEHEPEQLKEYIQQLKRNLRKIPILGYDFDFIDYLYIKQED